MVRCSICKCRFTCWQQHHPHLPELLWHLPGPDTSHMLNQCPWLLLQESWQVSFSCRYSRSHKYDKTVAIDLSQWQICQISAEPPPLAALFCPSLFVTVKDTLDGTAQANTVLRKGCYSVKLPASKLPRRRFPTQVCRQQATADTLQLWKPH